jgi:hypothetical protein
VPLLGSLSTVAVEKLAPAVLRGKQLFYDARDTRLALDAYLSCAACHNDGGHDGRVWDLTGLGEGLRNTISLRGRGGVQGMLHWSGNFDEVQDFEGQIRTLSRGTGLMTDAAFNQGTRSQPLGDPKAGISADLDALAAYVESLQVADASPNRLASGAMSTTAAAGRPIFQRECQFCHGFDEFTDSPARLLHDIGTLKPSSGQRLGKSLLGLDTPGLRGSWATPPYLHDGSAATLDAAILAHPNVNLTAAERTRVAAFVRELGDEEPVVPPVQGLYGQYFGNPTLTGRALSTLTSAVSFNWTTTAPAGLPVDGFSVRWSGKILATVAGNYKLRTYADDGVRLWVDGALVIDTWNTIGLLAQTSAALNWAAGSKHDVRLEYQEVSGNARVHLYWQVPGGGFVIIPAAQLERSGNGLTGEYFANNSLAESPVLTRYETPNFDWGGGSPDPSLPDNDFSVRWSGSLSPPADGQYVFQTVSDDGVRLWLNGALVIDNWTAHAPTTNTSPTIQLATGYRYDIKLEFQELGGGAVMQLSWLPPGASVFSAVPNQVLSGN